MARFPFAAGGDSADRTPVTNGTVPTVGTSARAATPAYPFAGTPAAAYADGASGIVVPRARGIGGFSAAQVSGAYKTVKRLLKAAYLDPRTLRGGSPGAFGRLLVDRQRSEFVRNLNKIGLRARVSARHVLRCR